MDERQGRQAKNEAVFRAVNREIEQASRELGDGELEVLCECGQSGCEALITMSVAEYDLVHAQRDRFVVLPGHEEKAIERVVEQTDRYVVVDKFGEAEEIVENSD